jgi:hypothetical protein
MAKLEAKYILTLTGTGILEKREPANDDEGEITLREPTNKEWNDYSADSFSFGKKGRNVKDNSGAARCKLFDRIVASIENIEDDRGFLTIEDLDRIPARFKQRAIFLVFEDEPEDGDDLAKN